MESDRSSASKSGERPVTRWRREHESSEKSQISERPSSGLARPYSKMERPTSRRGIKTDMTEYGMSRPPTSGKNVLSRPPSASLMLNRVPTPASRMSTMSSASIPRTNSGLMRNYMQPNTKIIDRPITQQGLAGIPTSSSKGIPRLTKQIQDKKYYANILQQKIRELNQEIETITQKVEKQNNRSRTYTDYDLNTKDSASELYKLQGQLTDYHNIFDKMVSGINKEEMINEAKKLKEFNDREENEMKTIFQKREQAEKKLIELNKEIELRKRMNEKIMENGDTDMKSKYDDLLKEKIELQKEMNILQKQQNQLSEEKTRMENKIAFSPIKQEAYKLYLKIFETERKRDNLLEQEKNSLVPKNNEKLNKENNQENMNIQSSENQIIEIEKKIADAKQELQQLENNKDETHLNKLIKNDEPHKEENIMDIFLSSFEKSKTEELDKFSRLEDEIIIHLEQISNNISENIDSNILLPDEMEMLKSLMEQGNENRNKKSFEELKEDNIKLQQILCKLKSLESKIITEADENNAKVQNNQTTNSKLKAPDNDKEQQKELLTQDDELIKQKKKDSKLKIMNERYSKLKEKIEENEIYRSISILEDKLIRISLDDEQIQQFIKEKNELDDSSSLLKKLDSLTTRYNAFLINEMKSIY